MSPVRRKDEEGIVESYVHTQLLASKKSQIQRCLIGMQGIDWDRKSDLNIGADDPPQDEQTDPWLFSKTIRYLIVAVCGLDKANYLKQTVKQWKS